MFLGGVGSGENTIAVRKAAEAGDDRAMPARRLDERRLVRVFRQSRKEAHRRLLIGEGLAMLERQVEEAAPNRHDRLIVGTGDGYAGDFQRCCVGCVSPRRIAEEIARKLVQ